MAAAPNPVTDPAGSMAVQVNGLTKAYGDVLAVRGIDLQIPVGEIFALLGPNGAGKTTTIEILEGYRARDGGTVAVLGLDPGRQRQRLKSRIGIVLQSAGVDRYLTVSETLAMYASYYPRPRPVGEVVELVGLEHKRDARVIKLSGGQQRRLDVAIALVGNPDLLFLDEPTTGFDPSARREAWEVVKNLADLGKTVLLTTHYMDEAQYLADRVAVIAAGRIVAQGPPATLGGREQARPRVRYRLPAGTAPPAGLGGPPDPDGRTEFTPGELAQALSQLSGWAISRGISLDTLEIIRPSLEDFYLTLTGDQAAEEPDGQQPGDRRPRRTRRGGPQEGLGAE
jgi:ABC-2 type transport system ATP-binding protein